MKLKSVFSVLMLSFICVGASLYAQKTPSRVLEYNGKPTPKNIVQIYAHRGLRSLLPENSLSGEIAAMRQGVDYIDIDVAFTKDGTLIVTHDIYPRWYITSKTDSKSRVIPIPKKKEIDPFSGLTEYSEGWDGYLQYHQDDFIYMKSYNEIKKNYSIGDADDRSIYKKYIFPHQASFEYMKYPTAKEVIDVSLKYGGKDIGIQIELKDNPEKHFKKFAPKPKEYANKVYKILKEKNIIDQVEIQAFNWNILIELKKLDKKIKVAFLTGIGADYHTHNDTMSLYTAGHYLNDSCNGGKGHKSLPVMIKDLGGDCYEPYALDLYKNPELIKQAHVLGLKVVPWMWAEGVSHDDNMLVYDSLVKNGVDGIIVDRMELFRAYLAAENYNVPSGIYIPSEVSKSSARGEPTRDFAKDKKLVDGWLKLIYK